LLTDKQTNNNDDYISSLTEVMHVVVRNAIFIRLVYNHNAHLIFPPCTNARIDRVLFLVVSRASCCACMAACV